LFLILKVVLFLSVGREAARGRQGPEFEQIPNVKCRALNCRNVPGKGNAGLLLQPVWPFVIRLGNHFKDSKHKQT